MEAIHRKAFHLEEFTNVHKTHTSTPDEIDHAVRRKTKKMKSIRSWIRFRPVIPAIIGVSLGFALSMFYIPIVEQQCLYDLEESQVYLMHRRNLRPLKESIGENLNRVTTNDPAMGHATVAPKPSHFNDGLRPFYIASELGKREKLLVGILTSEDHLDSLVLAINNTWTPDLPRVIFFIPYSRDAEFHDKYTKVLGIPVVQLDVDSEDDTAPKLKLQFKMLKHMHEHYINNYEWFMRVDDTTYVKSDKLLEFINSVNSSQMAYIGRPVAVSFSARFQSTHTTSHDLYHQENYCSGKTGVIISRTALMAVAPSLDNCADEALTDSDDEELGRCFHKTLNLHCTWSYQASEMFFEIPDDKKIDIVSLVKEKHMSHALTLSPLHDPLVFYQVHRYFTELELNRTFIETRMLQTAIKDMLPLLPEGVPEKHPAWPIGFPQPFKPTSRFEVIQWEYFNHNVSYGFTEVNPQVNLKGAYKQDAEEVIQTATRMLTHEHPDKKASLINGYRRVDPCRGAEYILDMELTSQEGRMERRRVHMLRPFTKVESIKMSATTEQRGVHLVLPVLKGQFDQLEMFLKMYQRVCLQTGENVVLLTVFVNVREDNDDAQAQDKFADGKALIARYKQKYTWAQFPWIQIGVQYNSLTLLMDIVTMKLPSNALIFLTSLDVEFTISFLNRCRVNALNGQQVFFPVPFAHYDPNIIYRKTKVPDEIHVHRDTGHWDTDIFNLVCFNNKDYKDNRINSEEFLKETKYHPKDFMKVFTNSKLHIFRAVDLDLQKNYHEMSCTSKSKDCLEKKAESMASRSQLALLLFDKELDQEKANTKQEM